MTARWMLALLLVASAGSARAEAPALDPSEMRHQLHQGPPGADTIVLIHGLAATRRSFDKVAGELGKRFNVLVYDGRGHGGTKGDGLDYSTRTMARDLEALRAHLGLGRVHLLGHSMGARTAVRYAAMFPQHVKSVIVEDMAFEPRKPADAGHQEDIRQRAIGLRQIAHQDASSRGEIRERLARFVDDGDSPWPSQVIEQQSMPLSDGRFRLGGHPEAQLLWQHQAGSEDLGQALRSIRAPMMVLQAERGGGAGRPAVITQAGRAHILANSPGTPIVVVPGSSHSIHNSQPEAFVEVVDAFVSGSGAAPAWIPAMERQALLRARGARPLVRWPHANDRGRARARARRGVRRR